MSSGSLLNEAPELGLLAALTSATLAGAAWSAITEPGHRVGSLTGVAVSMAILWLLVRGVRAGLYVGRTGILVRRTWRPRVERRWSEVGGFTVAEGPLGNTWRTLKVELDDDHGSLWIWRMRTMHGASGATPRSQSADGDGPGSVDDAADRLERLRRAASPGG